LGSQGAYRDYDQFRDYDPDPLPTTVVAATEAAEVAAETSTSSDGASLMSTTATNSNSFDLIPKDLVQKYFSKEHDDNVEPLNE